MIFLATLISNLLALWEAQCIKPFEIRSLLTHSTVFHPFISDLRKDWEIQKGSKLSKEEKKIFLKIGQDFLTKWYDQQENTDEQQTNPAKQGR